jgi:hypothetical protein
LEKGGEQWREAGEQKLGRGKLRHLRYTFRVYDSDPTAVWMMARTGEGDETQVQWQRETLAYPNTIYSSPWHPLPGILGKVMATSESMQ